MFKHLLVPTDGSALSEAAIQMAVTLASESGARVTGLHVIPEFHVLAYGAEVIADTEDQFSGCPRGPHKSGHAGRCRVRYVHQEPRSPIRGDYQRGGATKV